MIDTANALSRWAPHGVTGHAHGPLQAARRHHAQLAPPLLVPAALGLLGSFGTITRVRSTLSSRCAAATPVDVGSLSSNPLQGLRYVSSMSLMSQLTDSVRQLATRRSALRRASVSQDSASGYRRSRPAGGGKPVLCVGACWPRVGWRGCRHDPSGACRVRGLAAAGYPR